MDAMTLKAILTLDSSAYDKGLSDAKGKANGFGGAISKGLGSVGSTIGGALKAGIGAVVSGLAVATTAVTGFAVASVKSGAEFDTAMSQVAATMGVTTDEIGNLRDFAREMGATTAFSATQAAEALNYMALAGYDAETSMAMLPNVLNLAAAGTMDLARASDMLTDTQTAFGISLERTTLMVDEMAKAASTGNTSVEQLGDAFLTVGGLAQELNGGLVKTANGATVAVDGTQELEIALTAMANAGIKGSEAGTHMRNMLMKLSSPTSDGTKQLEALGVEVFNTEGKMRSLADIFTDLDSAMGGLTQEGKINAISDLFNTRDLASAEAMLNAVGQDWNDIGSKILDAKLPLEDAVNALMEGGNKWIEFGGAGKKNIEELAGAIRQDLVTENMSLNETIEDIAEKYNVSFEEAARAVGKVNIVLREAEGAAQKMADTQLGNLSGDIKLLKSAFTDLQITISDMASPALREFVQLGTRELGNLNTIFSSFDASPYTDELGRMSEEGAKAQEEFKKSQAEAMDDLFAGITEGVTMVADLIPSMIEYGSKLITALGQGVMQSLPVIIQSAVQVASQFGQAIVTGLPAIIDAGLQIVKGLLQSINQNKGAIVDGAKQLIEGIKEAFASNGPEIFEAGSEILAFLVESLIENIPMMVDSASALIASFIGFITDNLDMFVNVAVSIIQMLGQELVGNLPMLITSAIELITQLATALTDPSTLSALLQTGLQIVLMIAESLIDNIPRLIDAAVDIVQNLVTYIVENIDLIIDAAVELITALVTGLLENLPLLTSAAVQLIFALVSGLIQATPDILASGGKLIVSLISGIIAKLPEIVSNGTSIVASLIEGIMSVIGSILQAGIDLVTNFVQGISNTFHKIIDAGKQMIEKVKEGVSEKIEQAKDWGSNLIKNFVAGIKEKWEELKGTISGIGGSIGGLLGGGGKGGEEGGEEGGGGRGDSGTPSPSAGGGTTTQSANRYPAEGIYGDNIFSSKSPSSIYGESISASAQNITVNVTLEGGTDRLFRVMKAEAVRNEQITGVPAFSFT